MLKLDGEGTLKYISIDGKNLGTIHIGSPEKPEDKSVIHIQFSPYLWQTPYTVGKVTVESDATVHIRLVEKEK